jgi:hypothetical protein
MIRAELKDWFSPDVPEVWKWRPKSLDVRYYLELTIGTEDSPGGDLFGFTVVSPQALIESETKPAMWGRHHLIVMDYSWQTVLDQVNKVLDICEGETWSEVAGKLSRYFYWEFEDYQEEK